MRRIALAALLASAAGSGAAQTAAPAEPVDDAIVVTGSREGTLDITRLLTARDIYRAGRAEFAPTSVLLFQVRGSPGEDLSGVMLKLRSGAEERPIAVDADGRFTLPDLPAGAWELVHNRGKRRIAVRPLVRSAGATEEDRPLGDVRLQCRVAWELLKPAMSLGARAGFATLGGCASTHIAFYFRTTRPLAAATIIDGARTETLPIDPVKGFRAPLGDRSLPNTARVRLRFG